MNSAFRVVVYRVNEVGLLNNTHVADRSLSYLSILIRSNSQFTLMVSLVYRKIGWSDASRIRRRPSMVISVHVKLVRRHRKREDGNCNS